MLPQQYCLRWKYHHSNLQTMFSQLLDRGCFCDVTLACEGQLIRAHRVVLCACSTFFDTVLTNYASERDPIIIMKDVTFADVKCLIEFMYKGEINVEHAHLASLLKTADDLKIKGLAEVSWRDDEDVPPMATSASEFHSPKRLHDLYAHEQQRNTSPLLAERERKSPSPAASSMKHAPNMARMPTLTPIPPPHSIPADSTPAPVDYYMGPKRKRGRPPLDDAYDVFNIRKMTHYPGAYLESRHYGADDLRQPLAGPTASPPSSAAAVAAYQHHVHQQQTKQRMRQRQRRDLEAEEPAEIDEVQTDPEWITSNLEVNVGDGDQSIENGVDEPEVDVKQHKAVVEEAHVGHKKLDKKHREKTPDEKDTAIVVNGRGGTRKNSHEQRHEHREKPQVEVEEVQALELKKPRKEEEEHVTEEEAEEEPATVPQPVEEIESVKQVLDQQQQQQQQKPQPTPITTAAPTAASSHSLASVVSKSAHAHAHAANSALPHAHYGAKYAPEGYMLNEHGMLMAHDFVHALTVSIPVAPTVGPASANPAGVGVVTANGGDQEFADIKMEDFDASDLRLTSEEMSQWQDVIKMDDYLAKGRRPQFWEEPFTRRVLDAIKNKRLEMKKAARILGVSYGTLYGRYREVYGCLKHPYSSTNFRPPPSSQLAVPPRFDMMWPSPKRDSSGSSLAGQMEIGKIRPKDLSELWTRPQI